MNKILLIPGTFGSKLYKNGIHIWKNPLALAFGGFQKLKLENNDGIYPLGVENNTYEGFFKGMMEYEIDIFQYDWRKSIDYSSNLLSYILNKNEGKYNIIAHSEGCLVVLGADRTNMGKIVLSAPPLNGTMISALGLGGAKIPLFGNIENIRETLATFPSLYQMLPSDASLFPSLQKNNVCDPQFWKEKITFSLNPFSPQLKGNEIIIMSKGISTPGGVRWRDDGIIEIDDRWNIDGDSSVIFQEGLANFIVEGIDHVQMCSDPHVLEIFKEILS